MKFRIYQVKNGMTRKYGWMGWGERKEVLKTDHVDVDELYDLVWYDEWVTEKSDDEVLDKLFRMFNLDHPKNYPGRSMSVSDIVEIDGRFYYCDSAGWKRLKSKTVLGE